MKNIITWKLITDSLREQVPVMLLYVVESAGSSPGRQGFFMAVTANGNMAGSIGGGIMEHKFVEMAKERLKNEQVTIDLKKQVHSKSAARNQSGMICSGEQTILLFIIKPRDAPVIENIIASLQQYKNGTLILSPSGIDFDPAPPEMDFMVTLLSEDNWLYKEKTGYKQQLFIVGGGHCALALSTLMRTLDFYITVYDDRKELKTMLENKMAHQKYFVNDYSELRTYLPSGEHTHYVVIMTFGYRTDDIAVRALTDKHFRYLGLLGSKTKTTQMIDEYRKEGLAEDFLQRINTPVGLQINSQTPEEIAISIAAEIIREKNKRL
jgi:xanthine dehydrogenase accessory factor